MEANQCKIVALIQDDEISQALQVIESKQISGVDFSYQKVWLLGYLEMVVLCMSL